MAVSMVKGHAQGPGKPATNKKYSWTVADLIRLADGKAVEHWGWDDMAERMGSH